VKSRKKTAQFFIDALGYRVQTEFDLQFPDGSTTECIALEPPEKKLHDNVEVPWSSSIFLKGLLNVDFHLAPEIFVSDGDPDSVVGKWVAARENIGGIHHLAYQVDNVQAIMTEWQEKGYAEFLSDKPLTCPGLQQVFTKPSELTGVIYEFINRGKQGFCQENVLSLMDSTKDCK
jgi:hypothetical protein